MSIPREFMNKCSEDGCLKVVRSLCGSKFAPGNWCLCLREVLLELGFGECPFDECLFHQPGMLIILCVDNASTAAPDKENINNPVKELQDEGFDLQTEGDFIEHLGIGMEQRDDGTICMAQKGLIKKIIMTVKMEECKPNETPALTAASGLDVKGKPWDQNQWDHTSIVGMLLCVSNNTGPEIAFAVSQVA